MENSFEIPNSSTMMYDFFPWLRMTLCHDQVIRWAKAKVHVCSDSVLCQKQTLSGQNRVGISNNPTSTQNGLELVENQLSSSEYFPRIHID